MVEGVRKALFLLLISAGADVHAARVAENCFPTSAAGARSTIQPSTIIFEPKPVVSPDVAQEIRDNLLKLYSPEVSSMGGNLRIYETDNMQFAAYAHRDTPGEYGVEIYKGVRYHPLITLDAYALVICHEIGHHLGGFPEKSNASWAAVEGQADYYATLKCLRRYFRAAPVPTAPAPTERIGLDLVDQCQRSFADSTDVAICSRSLQASRDLGTVVGDLDGGPTPPDLETRDTTLVTRTLDSYPSPQCRLDTFRAGVLCPVPWSEALSPADPRPGACNVWRSPADARPPCWYAAGAGTAGSEGLTADTP